MTHVQDYSALIGSRICHDLISPLGAIGNGVELLSMTGHAQSPEMMLISESVENANARIRFFRVAFGAASADHLVARSEITSILGAAARGGRMSYIWGPKEDTSRIEVRAIFLALMCLETAMPLGGHVEILQNDETWILKGEAARLKIDPDLWACFDGDCNCEGLSAANVQFALLPRAIAEADRIMTTTIGEQEIEIRF